MSPNSAVYPTPLQLALATIVLRSKPEDVAVRDFLAILRANVRKTTEPPPYQQEAYLDGVEHWKSRCEQLEDEKTALVAEVVGLQRRNEELCAESTTKLRTETQPKNSNGKRKTPTPCGTPPPHDGANKRIRREEREGSLLSAMATSREREADNSEVLDVVAPESRLASCLYRIHQLLRPDRSPSNADLAMDITSACTALSMVVSKTCGAAAEANAPQLILPTGRALTTLLHATNRLEERLGEDDRKTKAAVVFSLVTVVQDILAALTANSLWRAQLEGAANDGSMGIDIQPVRTATETSTLFANLLLAVVSSECLRKSSDIHRSIYEGATYCVLQRAGICLNRLTYGRHTDDAGDEIPVIANVDIAIEVAAIKYEAMHLGLLVERISLLANDYLSPPDAGKLGRSKSVKPGARVKRNAKNTPVMELHQLIRDKLQQTLKDAVWPSGSQENDEFKDRLTMPRRVLLREPRRTTKLEKENMVEDTAEWFSGKLWGYVGWHILGMEAD